MVSVQPRKGNRKINTSVKQSTYKILIEKAGGTRKVGALIDQMMQEAEKRQAEAEAEEEQRIKDEEAQAEQEAYLAQEEPENQRGAPDI